MQIFGLRTTPWKITFGLIILSSVAGDDSLPEQISNRTNCQNGTLDVTFSPFCSVRRIAIKRLSYECISGTTCSDNIPTRLVSRSMLANAVSRVSGESHGVIGVDPHNCLNQHTFMKINYYCISPNHTLDICSGQTVDLKEIVYIMSKGYPHPVTQETSCDCFITLNSQRISMVTTSQQTIMPNISMVTIHSALVAGQQLLLTSSDGSLLKNITKNDETVYIIYEQFPFAALNVSWKSSATQAGGLFWMGFQSFDPSYTVSISCQKPPSIPTTFPAPSTSTALAITTKLSSSFNTTQQSISTVVSSGASPNSAPNPPSSVSVLKNSSAKVPYLTMSTDASLGSSVTSATGHALNTRSTRASLGSSISSGTSQALVTANLFSTVSSGREDVKFTPKDNSINLIPVIAGVLGAILLLVIIIIIFCILKRKKAKQNAVGPVTTTNEVSHKHLAENKTGITELDHKTSQVGKLPPIGPSLPLSSRAGKVFLGDETKIVKSADDTDSEFSDKETQQQKKEYNEKVPVHDQGENTKGDSDTEEHSKSYSNYDHLFY